MMATGRESSDLPISDPLVEDAKDAIVDFELNRLHQTYSMIDLETFHEDYRYIYRNRGSLSHAVAPLLWRNRAIQANMYVLDRSGGNLVYLPHGISHAAARLCIEKLLKSGLGRTAIVAGDAKPTTDAPSSAEIAAALAFESPQDIRELAYAKARALSTRFPAVPEFSKVATLLQFSLRYYLPLALFDDLVMPGQMAFLRHGVDIYRRLGDTGPEVPYLPFGARLARLATNALYGMFERKSKRWRVARLFFGRRYDFEVPLALDAPDAAGAGSFHLRVVIPPGLRVVKPVELRPDEVFAQKNLLRFASYDENNVYIYLRSNEIRSVLQQRDVIKSERSTELEKLASVQSVETLRAVRPRLKKPTVLKWLVDFLIELRDILLRSLDKESRVHLTLNIPLTFGGGIFTLIVFLWVPAVMIVVAALVRALTLEIFLGGLSVLFVVMLTIGIFAIDRRVLRGLVLAHAALALGLVVVAYVLSLIA